MTESSNVKIEIRVFKTEEHRNAHWQEDGDNLIGDPEEYGLQKMEYATKEANTRWKVRGIHPDLLSFAKVMGRAGEDEHEACHSTDLETAIGWLYNP